jgi:hypothetical protein
VDAKRWEVNLSTMPRISGIVGQLTKIDAIARSAPQKPA